MLFLNVNMAFLEKKNKKFAWFEEKLEQFGIEVKHPEDFKDLFVLNNEVSKAGKGDFEGLDLVAIDLNEKPTKLDENSVLSNVEPWKYAVVYSCMKNYRNSVIVVDEDDFETVIESLNECGDVTLQERRELSLKALYRLLRINSLVHKELSDLFATEKFESIILEEIAPLRYGENPHQFAHISKIAKEKAFFDFIDDDELLGMSYNNLIDLHLALSLLKILRDKFVVRVHHGIIVEVSQSKYNFSKVRGVVAANLINEELKDALKDNDLDVVAIPVGKEFNVKVRKLVRFDTNDIHLSDVEYRFLDRNFLVQTVDDLGKMRFSSKEDNPQYRWANTIVALSNSMACCIFKENEMVALGSGQTDQIDALEIALLRARRSGKKVENAIFAFDGPIKDERVVNKLLEIGKGVVLEPGGSKMDPHVKEKLESANMKLIFTGKRRYKH